MFQDCKFEKFQFQEPLNVFKVKLYNNLFFKIGWFKIQHIDLYIFALKTFNGSWNWNFSNLQSWNTHNSSVDRPIVTEPPPFFVHGKIWSWTFISDKKNFGTFITWRVFRPTFGVDFFEKSGFRVQKSIFGKNDFCQNNQHEKLYRTPHSPKIVAKNGILIWICAFQVTKKKKLNVCIGAIK